MWGLFVTYGCTWRILWFMSLLAQGALPLRADPDAALVVRAQEGDEAAFEELLCRHEAMIYRLARRMIGNEADALDAAQETAIRVFKGLRSFRGAASFKTWVTGIAINVCRNRLTSAATRAARSSRSLDGDPSDGEEARPFILSDPRPDPEVQAIGAELRYALERALGTLEPEQREILLLREMEGLEYEELANALGCPIGTVKSRLCRARAAVRQALRGIWP
jgi:RNA polymerase sigma-70 factor, ECF subfamily